MPHAQVLEAFAGHAGGRLIVANAGADPAAGAEISVTVPGRAVWQVHAVTAVLTTDATVANRRPRFRINAPQGIIYEVGPTAAHTASLAVRYSLAPGVGGQTDIAGLDVVLPLPPLILLPGWTITTSTGAIVAGDNWGPPLLYVTEIPERGAAVWDDMLNNLAREIAQRRFENV